MVTLGPMLTVARIVSSVVMTFAACGRLTCRSAPRVRRGRHAASLVCLEAAAVFAFWEA